MYYVQTVLCLSSDLASSQSRDDKVLSVGALAEECNRTLQRIAQWKCHLCGPGIEHMYDIYIPHTEYACGIADDRPCTWALQLCYWGSGATSEL